MFGLRNTFLNDQIRHYSENKTYFEPNGNENAIYQSLCDTAKAELRHVVLQIHILVKEKA